MAIDPAVSERIGARLRDAAEGRASFQRAIKDFDYFLGFWKFRSRETGAVLDFAPGHRWLAQQRYVDAARQADWLFALKSGKLGLSEAACAFDVWRALSTPGSRVAILSKDLVAAGDLLAYVRFGLVSFPESWGIRLLSEAAGGDSSRSLKFTSRLFTEGDVRTIVSLPATEHTGIDQTVQHLHADEMAHWPFPEKTWNSLATTVAPNGSLHVVTRGAGPGFCADLYRLTVEGKAGRLQPFFAGWQERPGRDEAWRAEQMTRLTEAGANHFLPADWVDALVGDATSAFCRPEWWAACLDKTIPPLLPGDRTPLVVGLDAGIVDDTFAVVVVSRHHVLHDEITVRMVKCFDPRESNGVVDLAECEAYVRRLAADYNIIQCCFDGYQLQQFAQNLRRDDVCWVDEFGQGPERLKSDRQLYDRIVTRTLHHPGEPLLTQHILDAAVRQTRDDSGMRLVKASQSRKIDLAVALSMSSARCSYLVL